MCLSGDHGNVASSRFWTQGSNYHNTGATPGDGPENVVDGFVTLVVLAFVFGIFLLLALVSSFGRKSRRVVDDQVEATMLDEGVELVMTCSQLLPTVSSSRSCQLFHRAFRTTLP
jgi:hypothetical protein